ncbi:MAG TPA: CD225/dispanin family protein, partial [Verrucomicrobiota bacterium]|nr:CD225/dispanin family protein [Verrucomicrobiota bacterium]
CTLFCCLPFGIAGILFAVQANSKVQQGDIDGAAVAASRAKLMCILSFVLGLITLILFFGTGGFDRLLQDMQESMPR